MTLLTLMDAIQVHAAAAAVVAGTSAFKDVAVGFPAARGRCVRIFYGGEREPEHFPDDKTLNSQMVAQAIVIRAYWPVPQAATKEARRLEGEMATFVKELRTRILGDSQLGSAGLDLNLSHAAVDQAVISGTSYVIADLEAVVDGDEYSIAP